MREYAPVALFVYRREDHARRTIESLASNDCAANTDLFIFSDGASGANDAADVTRVRDHIETVGGFRSVTIIRSERNLGLAASIVRGVGQVLDGRESVIVVEDDLVTSPFFLRYMNDGLDMYRDDDRVTSIAGYTFPVGRALPETFFLRAIESWGWATWRRAWKLFDADGQSLLRRLEDSNHTRDFDFNGTFGYTEMLRAQTAGRNDSWAVRWYASAFLGDRLTLFPGRSLVQNIGNDATGVHSIESTHFDIAPATTPVRVVRIPVQESAEGRQAFEKYFRGLSSLRHRILMRLRRVF